MKIDCQLDYQTILRNQAQPVHVVVKLTAEKIENQRQNPLAFCVVLDRSGSMKGKPLEHARKACELVVRNLRKEDYFALVIFDDEAQVLVPLSPVVIFTKKGSKEAIYGFMLSVALCGSHSIIVLTQIKEGGIEFRGLHRVSSASRQRDAVFVAKRPPINS